MVVPWYYIILLHPVRRTEMSVHSLEKKVALDFFFFFVLVAGLDQHSTKFMCICACVVDIPVDGKVDFSLLFFYSLRSAAVRFLGNLFMFFIFSV